MWHVIDVAVPLAHRWQLAVVMGSCGGWAWWCEVTYLMGAYERVSRGNRFIPECHELFSHQTAYPAGTQALLSGLDPNAPPGKKTINVKPRIWKGKWIRGNEVSRKRMFYITNHLQHLDCKVANLMHCLGLGWFLLSYTSLVTIATSFS